jgi:uncharacterized repeat protein (TIGR03803 family)
MEDHPMKRAYFICLILCLTTLAARSAQAQTGPYGVVSPTTLNFQVVLGQTSPPQLVSLKNTGDSQLTISNISTSENFAIATNHCANGVKPGTHCNVDVTFTPQALGAKTGTLTFTDNASNNPQTVSLTGNGINSSPTETVLYNFTGSPDGANPTSLTADGKGNFYGTTNSGGLGYGTVFELSPNGVGSWNETVLYSFTGGADGREPISYVILDSVGNIYGTAYEGGANGYGVVFELSPVGASWMETVLYSFAGGAGGAYPGTGLVMDPVGNLYGTTVNGSPGGTAIVFELSPSGGYWTEQVIYTIAPPLLVSLSNGLTMDPAGNIFGTTNSTVFELSPDGLGAWNPTVIHTFCGPKDGCYPAGTLVFDQAGNLYGTTEVGGRGKGEKVGHGGKLPGYGTVYELSPGESGWTEEILYLFKGGEDGGYPSSGVVLDAAGNIYGTTELGGYYYYDGAVFELVAPSGKAKYKETILWSFDGGADGLAPCCNLILDSAGNLYGTDGNYNVFKGTYGYGIVFEVTP